MKPTDTDSIDAILDAGAAGLRYFEVFGPRYLEWTGHTPAGGDYFALAAQYDQQRGTDLESLRGLATVLGEELAGRLNDQVAAQTARFGEVSAYWNGSSAADDAQQYLTDTDTTVTSNVDTLRGVHAATNTAVTQIDDAVRAKADTINNEFDPATAAGKTPQQIDWLIDLARGCGDTSQSVQDRLRTELAGHYVEGSEPAAACRTWLDKVFVTEFDTKVARFTTVCSEAHTTVTGAYTQLVTAIEGIDPAAFRSPGGAPATDTELTATSGQPVYLAAVGTPQASTEPDSESAPAGQNPAQTTPELPQNPAGPSTPSSLALNTTPAAAEISETAGLDTETTTGAPVVAGAPSNTDDSATAGNDTGLGSEHSTTGDDAALGSAPTMPPAETGTSGEWTPADITAMVTAVGTITGTIPDMITAVGSLAGNLDEIITATGDATAAIIDATDNQPSTPAGPAEPDLPLPEAPDDSAVVDDGGQEELLVDVGEDAGDEEIAATLDEETPVETQPQGVEDTTGDDEGQDAQPAAPTTPLAPALGANPVLATAVSSLRGLAPTPPGTAGHRTSPAVATASTQEPESTLAL